jgi:hypothetical protein
MRVDHSKVWRFATIAAVAVWLVFAIHLMVADVWDETNGMLLFSSATSSLAQKLGFVLTHSVGFWRPLPTLLAAVVLHAVRDFDVSWRLLRFFDMAMLLGALAMFDAALVEWSGPSEPRRFVLAIALLYSGSAVITAGWYANLFDAAVLLLVAAGTLLLARQRSISAGLLFGIAFFCKETAVLVLPFLLILLAAERIRLRDAVRAATPAVILGVVYFGLRSSIIGFGSETDVHQFLPGMLLPTAFHLAESFWRQTMKGFGPGIAGYFWIGLSLVSFTRPRVIAAALSLLAATTLIYWGMFGQYQSGILMHHLDFVGRLYLVPVALMLFALAVERRTVVVAVLCIPILLGGIATYRDHLRFQRTYRRIYRTAQESAVKPLTVDYPTKPLDDTVRGIRIGDTPGAAVTIDPKSGRLRF